ncbi:hypothetical protein AAFC00_000694 [Neodothiora populina]
MSNPQDEDIETLFALWLLILQFSLYDPDLVEASHIHLSGIHSFLINYFNADSTVRARDLPPASKQLLLFIAYLDVNFALSKPGSGQLFASMILEPPNSEIAHDRIFQEARVCLPKIWGNLYPATEVIDDMENTRSLSLLHECQRLKLLLRSENLPTSSSSVSEVTNLEDIWHIIEKIGTEYFDVLHLARTVPNSNGRRLIWTVYHAAIEYHALKILYTCTDGAEPSPDWLDTTIAELLAIAYKAEQENSHQQYRLASALSIALLKTQDQIHRNWLQVRVERAKALFSSIATVPATTPRRRPLLESAWSNDPISLVHR